MRLTDGLALLPQFRPNPGAAVAPAGFPVDPPDTLGQHGIRHRARAGPPLLPSIEAAGRHTQHAAQGTHREVGLVRHHECEEFDGEPSLLLANQAVAFAKMSRSILSCRFS